MFNKKKCKRCGKKVEKDDSFCSNCGLSVNTSDREEDWGMLGKDDRISPESMIPGFNMIFNSLMRDFGSQFKEIEKELNRGMEKDSKPNKRGISISISTSGNSPPKISINNLNGEPLKQVQKEAPVKKRQGILALMSEEKAKNFLKLPQEEPMTKIRRLSNKVVYEIELPGVKSLKNVSIMQLENSIEIKAVSSEKSYKKIIAIDFPIKKFKLQKEKLILELGVKQ